MHRDVQPSDRSPRRSRGDGGRSIIAVIGIDRYEAWPRLDNAVNDARGTARIFTQLGFVELTPPLIDGAATAEAMRHLVIDELAQLEPNDSLVLFFAGHGHTHAARFGDVSVKTGYVMPADAAPSRGQAAASWIRLDAWLSDIARLPPRHILVMLDACHSGVALTAQHKWRDTGTALHGELDALQARRSRRVIASALDDQRAMDGGPYPGHSLFTGCLIEGLSGGLLEDGREAATGREIGLYIQRRVRSYPHTTQTPDFGAFELDDRGDIVVPILGPEPVSAAPEPTFLVDWSQLSARPGVTEPRPAVAQLRASEPILPTEPTAHVASDVAALMPTLLTRSPANSAGRTLIAKRSRAPLSIAIAGFVAIVGVVAIVLVRAGGTATSRKDRPSPSPSPPRPALMLPSPGPGVQWASVPNRAAAHGVAWSLDHATPCPEAAMPGAPSDSWAHPFAIPCTERADGPSVDKISTGPDRTRGVAGDTPSWAFDGRVTDLVRGERWWIAVPVPPAKPPPKSQSAAREPARRPDVPNQPRLPVPLDENGAPVTR